MMTFVVLGDSAGRGVGDQDSAGEYRGFGHYLSRAFVGHVRYHNVSRPGARAAEVREKQLPLALSLGATHAVVVVGGNDVLRNDFNPNRMYDDIRAVVLALRESGCTVVSMNLHDPLRVVPLPGALGRVMYRRVQAVNSVYRALARDLGLAVLDIHERDEVYSRDLWHIDRLHPSRRGHQMLASTFAVLLRDHGVAVGDVDIESPIPARRRDNIRWLLVNGTPWVLKRSFDLLPAMLLLTIIEKVGLGGRLTPQFDAEAITSRGDAPGELVAA